MAHLDAMIGIVVLMSISLWIVSKIGDGPSIAISLVRPVLREHPDRVPEEEPVPWRWGPKPPDSPPATGDETTQVGPRSG